jgi:hypothetical protein
LVEKIGPMRSEIEMLLFEFVTNNKSTQLLEYKSLEESSYTLNGVSIEKIKKKEIQIILQILENNYPISSLMEWFHQNASNFPDFSALDSLLSTLFILQRKEENFRLEIFKFLKNIILEHPFKPFIHWSISFMNDLILQLFEEPKEQALLALFQDVFLYLKEFNHYTFSLDLLFTIAEYSLFFEEEKQIPFKDFFLKSTPKNITGSKSLSHLKNIEILKNQKFHAEKLTLESFEADWRGILNYFNQTNENLGNLELNEEFNLILKNESIAMSDFLSLIWRLKVDDEMISLFRFYLKISSLEFIESMIFMNINVGGVLLFLFKLISHPLVYSLENYQLLVETFYYFLNIELFSDQSK